MVLLSFLNMNGSTEHICYTVDVEADMCLTTLYNNLSLCKFYKLHPGLLLILRRHPLKFLSMFGTMFSKLIFVNSQFGQDWPARTWKNYLTSGVSLKRRSASHISFNIIIICSMLCDILFLKEIEIALDGKFPIPVWNNGTVLLRLDDADLPFPLFFGVQRSESVSSFKLLGFKRQHNPPST